MLTLPIFLMWLFGLPLMLMLDSYLQGRFKRTIFAVNDDDNVDGATPREFSMFFWPIYFSWRIVRNIVVFICKTIHYHCVQAMRFCETKGEQANDLDYQAEKYLLRKDD